jgi:NADPH:quinone reductase-like Zn-dependent oxidoreductase
MPGNLKALDPDGRIVVIGVGAGPTTELNLLALMGKRARIQGSTMRARPLEEKAVVARRVESQVLPLVEAGVIEVPVAGSFPLDQVGEAYDRFTAGRKFGKVVLLSG